MTRVLLLLLQQKLFRLRLQTEVEVETVEVVEVVMEVIGRPST
jgi:hypothetical protein